jgi:hypothetical protein
MYAPKRRISDWRTLSSTPSVGRIPVKEFRILSHLGFYFLASVKLIFKRSHRKKSMRFTSGDPDGQIVIYHIQKIGVKGSVISLEVCGGTPTQ